MDEGVAEVSCVQIHVEIKTRKDKNGDEKGKTNEAREGFYIPSISTIYAPMHAGTDVIYE